MKSDGTHTTLKPSQLSVARITVVRGLVQSEVRVVHVNQALHCVM